MEEAAYQPIPKADRRPQKLDPSIAERVRQLRQASGEGEIERRRGAWAELLKVRDQLPMMEESVTDLLRRAREDKDARLDG